jgi:hypothetical protein
MQAKYRRILNIDCLNFVKFNYSPGLLCEILKTFFNGSFDGNHC